MDRSRAGDLNNDELTEPRGGQAKSLVEGLEVIDLGDPRKETKQVSQFPRYADSVFGVGWAPD
jgi:hypothetical protein